MSADFIEPTRPMGYYVKEAIKAAKEGDWERAIDINKFIIERWGENAEAYNRLGKALWELGQLKEALEAYTKSSNLDRYNIIAQKNVARLEELLSSGDKVQRVPLTGFDTERFIEEAGKSTGTYIDGVTQQDRAKLAPGDVLEVVADRYGVHFLYRGEVIGDVEPKLATRLKSFIAGGNRYEAVVTSLEGDSVRVIVRELYQDPAFIGVPSFPGRKRREAEYRALAKEPLELEEEEEEQPLEFVGEEELEEPVEETLEGMHVIEEDEPLEEVELEEELDDTIIDLNVEGEDEDESF